MTAGSAALAERIAAIASDKKATDDLSATLKGKVNIEFATDYFKLDNFASLYQDGRDGGAVTAAAPGTAVARAPAVPAPPAAAGPTR